MSTFRVGDKVWYRGSWGRDAARPGTLTDIEVTKPGEKYGEQVDSVSADHRNWVAGVQLDNGDTKWGYEYQFTKRIQSDES